MRVYTPKKTQRHVTKQITADLLAASSTTANQHEQLNLLAKASHEHPWTYATLDAVSRSVVGAGWKFIPVPELKEQATKRQKRKLEDFFSYAARTWDNIKDFQSLPDKMALTYNSYRLTGHAAWEIVRDGAGLPIGFDVLAGLTVPQVDGQGYFTNPAFLFYPWGKNKPIEYAREEIAYFFNSGITGRITGESPYEALMNTTLPSDLFAAISYRSLFENVNSPYNGFWMVDPSVTDEDFDMFIGLLEERYSGAANFGRNPLVIRGGADFKTVKSRNNEDAPYLEGRTYNREEFFGVTGVDGNKLGITDASNKSNMRESRREFHENTLRPLFKKLEDDIYYQVIVRILGITAWQLKFNQPDITNAVEQVSIDMRRIQWGINSPNEIRVERGDEPREGGDNFLVPMNMIQVTPEGEFIIVSGPSRQGEDVPEDQPEQPTDPNQPAQRIPRDEDATSKIVHELKTWKRTYLRFLDGKRATASFETNYIDKSVKAVIDDFLSQAGSDFELVKHIFDSAIEMEENRYGT